MEYKDLSAAVRLVGGVELVGGPVVHNGGII